MDRLRRHFHAYISSEVVMKEALLWLVVALSRLAGGVDAAVCAKTGEAAPAVITVMASTTKPATEGWLVQPNCNVAVFNSASSVTFLESKGIERVASFPAFPSSFTLIGNPLSRGANFSSATQLQSLTLGKFSPKLADDLVLPNSLKQLVLQDSAITSLNKVALPPSMTSLYIRNSALTSFDAVALPSALETLEIKDIKLASIDNVAFPDKLQTLDLDAPLKSIDSVTFPPFLSLLSIRSQAIVSLKDAKLPSTLKYLLLETMAPRLDFDIPSKLVDLAVYRSPIPVLERVIFPSSLRSMVFDSCNTTVVRGIMWPTKLTDVNFGPLPVATFEIRQSDVQLMASLTPLYWPYMNLSGTVCTDPSGNLTEVKKGLPVNWKMCVISDERFTALYGGTGEATPSVIPSAGSSSTGSGSSSEGPQEPTSGSASESESESEEVVGGDGNTGISGTGKKTRTPSSQRPGSSQSRSPTSPISASGSLAEPKSSRSPQSTRRSNSTNVGTQSGVQSETPDATRGVSDDVQVGEPLARTMVIAAVVAGVVFVLAIVGFGVRLLVTSSKQRDDDKERYSSLETPSTTSDSYQASQLLTGQASVKVSDSDLSNDKLLLHFRLQPKDLVLDKLRTRQGYLEEMHGTHNGRDVSVKRIQAAFRSDEGVVSSFADAIRTSVSLDHPKITALVGIVWNSQHDMSVVFERMSGGDLQTLLHSQTQSPTVQDWSAEWTPSKIKSKLLIALDVADALAYLHSFTSPILHRDLRSRNVLLDDQGNAKLDSFAISRVASVDETMRGEVGSVAWIAPEVILGEIYTEKADVYALGVLLVELDRCRHPYAREVVSEGGESTGNGTSSVNEITQKNIQIAVRVSSGDLRPSVSSSCPEPVGALVTKCLSFDAANRPTVKDVVAELIEIRNMLQ